MISRRKFTKKIATSALASGVFMGAGSALADGGGGGGGKVQVNDISAIFSGQGDGSPKSLKIRFSGKELEFVNSVKPEERPKAIAQVLDEKMANEWTIRKEETEFDISLEDIQSVLDKGEGVVRAMSRGPKFEITIKIVIKF